MKTKILLFSVLSLLSLGAQAQSSPFSLSGSVDTYFRANLNDDRDQSPNTSFANLPGFSLGMVNLVGSVQGEKIGAVADLVFGPRGEEAVFNSTGSSNIVNQLYVFWDVSDKLTLTAGNFNTFLGYEVISPVVNFNYSTSYMFSYGPFSHTGIKADYQISDDFSIMLAALNPTDYTEFNPSGTTTLGAQVGFFNQYINVLYGKQAEDASATFQIDYTGGFDLGPSFFVGLNATLNTTELTEVEDTGFYGAAAYLQYTTSETVALGLRGEYFSEFGAFGAIGYYDADGDADVIALTLSANIGLGEGFKIIPELRADFTSEPSFSNDLELNDSLYSFAVAAVYAF